MHKQIMWYQVSLEVCFLQVHASDSGWRRQCGEPPGRKP